MFNPFDNQNEPTVIQSHLPGIQVQNNNIDNLYRQIATGGYGGQVGSRLPRSNIDFGNGASSGGRYDIPMPAKARVATPQDASMYPMNRFRTRVSAPGMSTTGGFNLGTPSGNGGGEQVVQVPRRLSRRKIE
jgi:hypothetical protein